MKSISNDILHPFANLSMRLEKSIFLPLSMESGDVSDDLEDFIREDFPSDDDHPLFGQWPSAAQFKEAVLSPAVDEFIDVLLEFEDWGWLIQVARPVMDYAPDCGSASFSWGLYKTQWVYGASFAEAIERAIEWGGKMDAQDRAKAQRGAI